MENTRNIEEITAWTSTGAKAANRIILYNFTNYNFRSVDESSVYFQLAKARIDENNNPVLDENGNEATDFVVGGVVGIPYEIICAWGEDDEPIFDYVISQLGLTKI